MFLEVKKSNVDFNLMMLVKALLQVEKSDLADEICIKEGLLHNFVCLNVTTQLRLQMEYGGFKRDNFFLLSVMPAIIAVKGFLTPSDLRKSSY